MESFWKIPPTVPVFVVLLPGCAAVSDSTESGEMLAFHTRSRARAKGDAPAPVETLHRRVEWPASRTALVVCDMWDDHWCRGAARRVREMAPAVDRLVRRAREKGVFIIHAPSTTVDTYKETAARRRAIEAPHAEPPVALSTSERWGTAWCWPDPEREAELPIDDSDMGCDCPVKCTIRDAWSRQIDTIEIDPRDAVSDNGQEVYNLLAARGIENVLILGVHLNMCVLGRPFGIRQLVKLGKEVLLVRNLTDTMYNSQMPPFVSHFEGTERVIEHVETYWCPTVTSADLTGEPPFRFAEDPRPREAALSE